MPTTATRCCRNQWRPTSQSYNAFGELQSHSATHGGTTLFAQSFAYDNAGRIVGKTEQVSGQTDKHGAGFGFYGEAGASAGPVGGKIEGNFGRNFHFGRGSELYRTFDPKASLGKEGRWGYKAGASCGIEWSIF
jgi:YD repeat-containing protein